MTFTTRMWALHFRILFVWVVLIRGSNAAYSVRLHPRGYSSGSTSITSSVFGLVRRLRAHHQETRQGPARPPSQSAPPKLPSPGSTTRIKRVVMLHSAPVVVVVVVATFGSGHHFWNTVTDRPWTSTPMGLSRANLCCCTCPGWTGHSCVPFSSIRSCTHCLMSGV